MANTRGFFDEKQAGKKRKLSFVTVELRSKRAAINKIDSLRSMQGLRPSGYADIINSVSLNLLQTELAEMRQNLDYQHGS